MLIPIDEHIQQYGVEDLARDAGDGNNSGVRD